MHALYVRMLVGIDLPMPPPNELFVTREDNTKLGVKVEYEKMPTFCEICGVIGHSIMKCKKLEKKKQIQATASVRQQQDFADAHEQGYNDKQVIMKLIKEQIKESPSLTLAGTTTSDPTSAVSVAHIKGGLPPPGLLQAAHFANQSGGNPYMSATFPYGVQVKTAEQKQPTGNDNLHACWQPEKR